MLAGFELPMAGFLVRAGRRANVRRTSGRKDIATQAAQAGMQVRCHALPGNVSGAGHSPLALKTNSTPSLSQGENELDATQSSNEGDRERLEYTQHATKTKANQIFTALGAVMLAGWQTL